MAGFLWNAANDFGNFNDPAQWLPLGRGAGVPGATDVALYSENADG